MTLIRIDSFTISLDGYGAGPDQSLAAPMGVGGERLHGWAFATRTFRAMFGQEGGTDGIDEGFAAAGMAGLGAWVLGRNMFAHSRGPWQDDGWRGWWGEEPPYACPVFVRSHHRRPDLQVGKTRFTFTAKPLREVVEMAHEAAGGRDIRIGGGVATVREALADGRADRVHLAISPVLLGRGEAL
jgi:dihydrofolate reductase